MAHDAVPADADATLVERAKARSESAWAEIYDAHYHQLFRYCYARSSDEAAAADLASRVFLEALEGIDRYVYRGRPLLAWLYRIARNLVSDHLRARQREAQALERAGSTLERHEPNPSSQVHLELDIAGAMQTLTEDQRQVIALRYFAELSTAEIAQALRRSERAVYSLEVRALAAMRRRLEPEPGAPK
ncbi:MAG TPA: RNA polymerase sigma factor [Burkholderiales bacterium]|nr:RNA polymerase sigma factor [Burkholderiales bacterium]